MSDSTWTRHYSQSNKRFYYANSLTDEKLFEALGAEANSGWIREQEYYSGELKKYRNVYTNEIKYDHVVGGAFQSAKSYPSTDQNPSNETNKKRKYYDLNQDNYNGNGNESKDHMEPSQKISTSRSSSSSLSLSTTSNTIPNISTPTSTSNHRTMQVSKNFLTLQSQKHANWLFGGLAEIIHNSSDAGATQLRINYTQDLAHNNDDIISIWDNGTGMSPETVQNILLSFGRDYDPNTRDINRIGCYGVGFKQGSIRVGSTVVFLTKFLETKTITLGIVCNKPYEESNEMFIYEHATLTYPTYRVNEFYCSELQYEKTMKLMAKYSFLNRENISNLIEKEFSLHTSGTIIFIQHWRRGFDQMMYEQEVNDFRLYSNLQFQNKSLEEQTKEQKERHLFRQSSHESIDRSEIIWIDCSLKEYLKYMFYSTNMTISLCGEIITTSQMDKELTNIQSLHLLPSINGLSPISGYIGKSITWERQKIGGAMLYGSNCLIRSFVRNEIGLYNASEGWGVVLIVNIPVGTTMKGSGINTTQDKQNFEGNSSYIQLLQRIGHEFQRYIQQTEFPITAIDSINSIKSDWIQCEQCGKWRRVPEAIVNKFHGNIPYYCFHQYSPIMMKLIASGKTNTELTRRLACETSQEDYSEEMTQSITTGYEDFIQHKPSSSSSSSTSLPSSSSSSRSSSSPAMPLSISTTSKHSSSSFSSSPFSIPIHPPEISTSSIPDQSNLSQSSQNTIPFNAPDLYYTLHHPEELVFNWKGEISSLERVVPEVLPRHYESLYAHLHEDETQLHHASPYYTCTSDFFYALYVSWLLFMKYDKRFPILKISSQYVESLASGQSLFDLSSLNGFHECQTNGILTTKQVAVLSTKCLQYSLYILRGKIPSYAITAFYNPFPLTLSNQSTAFPSSSSSSSSSSSPHLRLSGISLRQSIERFNHLLSSGYNNWYKQVIISFHSNQQLTNLQNEMNLLFVCESPPPSPSSSSSSPYSSSSSPSSSSSSSSPSPSSSSSPSSSLVLMLPSTARAINDFHEKLSLFFQIHPFLPFWLSDTLVKIINSLHQKKYHTCVKFIQDCYEHSLWNTFETENIQQNEKNKLKIKSGLKVYRDEVKRCVRRDKLTAELEVIKQLKILFNRLKGV